MNYAYLRVSTNHQDLENQKSGIVEWARKNNLSVDFYIEENASGKLEPDKRILGTTLGKMNEGDILICSELSRLGRSLFMIMRILEECMNRGIRVHTVKEGYELGDNIQSKVLAFAFGLSAEIERDLISQRTREALQRRKAEGAVLGRTPGQRCRLNPVCSENHELIETLLASGISKREICRRLGIGLNTLYRYLTYTGLHTPDTNRHSPWTGGIYR